MRTSRAIPVILALVLPGSGALAAPPGGEPATINAPVPSTDGQRQNLLRLIEVEQGLVRVLHVLRGPSASPKAGFEPLEAAQRSPGDAVPSEAQVERDSLAALVRINQDLQEVLATLATRPRNQAARE